MEWMKRAFLMLIWAGFLVTGTVSTGIAKLTEQAVLASVADTGVHPGLARTADTAAQLDHAVKLLCRNRTDAALEQARDAWRDAYLAWCESAPFMLGSAGLAERKIGKWPANGVVLDAAVQRDDLAHMLSQPDARGYAGAEHLLFGPDNAGAAVADRRCDHLISVTQEIVRLTAEARENWDTRVGERFKLAGNGDPFLLPSDALSLLLARVLNVTETMLRDRIAVVSNFFETPSRPDSLEAWRSRTSIDAFKASVSGIRKAVVGDGVTGITRLVATKDGLYEKKDPGLAKDILKQLDKIEKALAKLEKNKTDLFTRIKQDPDTLEKLYRQINTLQAQLVEASLVLELDVRSALEIQLTE